MDNERPKSNRVTVGLFLTNRNSAWSRRPIGSARTLLCALGVIATIGFPESRATAQAITTSYVPVTAKAGSGATVTESTTNGKTFYDTIFNPIGGYSSLSFFPSNGNLSNASAILIDVKSNNDTAVTLVIKVVDRSGAVFTGNATLVPRTEKTIALPFTSLQPSKFGMLSSPQVVKYLANDVQQVDENFVSPSSTTWAGPSSVGAIQVQTFPSTGPIFLSFGQPQIQTSGVISNVYTNFVDNYGQNTQFSWPEKVSSLTDMQSKDNTETQQLRQWTADRSDVDAFGGIVSRPLPNKSGFFRSYFSNGRWWFVTPQGHAFFQLGLDVVTPENGYTITGGRDWMFENIANLRATYADQTAPLNAKSGIEYFNHYGANLELKYGTGTDSATGLPNYLEQFTKRASWRLEGWRFNTVGWSSHDQFARKPTLPFVFGVKLGHFFSGAVVAGFASNHLGLLPDPFDPTFDSAVKAMVKAIPSYLIAQNYLIGYFVDNEIAWGNNAPGADYKTYYAVPVNTLALNSHISPAKRAFLALLEKKYGNNIAHLNAFWGTSIASWDELGFPFSNLPTTANANMKADFSAFLTEFANQYFGTVQKELKAYDPNHMYLGCRFAQQERPAEVVASCAAHADAVSFNYYAYHPTSDQIALIKSANKPAIISEFHFGSRDRGPAWPGLADAGSEANRGYWYAQYVNAIAAIPNVVGLDYYQFLDEPTAGEPFDKANGHIGFVSIGDVAFSDFAASVRATNLNAAAVHAGTATATTTK